MAQNDPARLIIDKKLLKLLRRFRREYNHALSRAKDRMNEYLEPLERRDAELLASYQGDRLKNERMRLIMQGVGWSALVALIANDLVSTDQKSISLIRAFIPDAYAESFNFGKYEVEIGTKLVLDFSLYSREAVENLIKAHPRVLPMPDLDIAKDERWNRQKIASAMTQGIMAGDSIPHLADRLERVTNMDRVAAVRNARTWTTAAEGKGRLDSYKRAESKGINIAKQWIAIHDMHTRMSHALIDGEICELDEEFANGLMFPGDSNGPPEEICNCRCTMMSVLRDYDFAGYDHVFDPDAYEEWKSEQEYED